MNQNLQIKYSQTNRVLNTDWSKTFVFMKLFLSNTLLKRYWELFLYVFTKQWKTNLLKNLFKIVYMWFKAWKRPQVHNSYWPGMDEIGHRNGLATEVACCHSNWKYENCHELLRVKFFYWLLQSGYFVSYVPLGEIHPEHRLKN